MAASNVAKLGTATPVIIMLKKTFWFAMIPSSRWR
jgi:hypothetical protein